jgi:phage FluMu protein Com
MTTIGYIYYECPKCKEVLSQFSELSSFTPAGTARYTDGAEESVMSWESGYLKQCPTCKHADLPSNFKTVSPEGASKPFDLDSGNFRSIKSITDLETIEAWLKFNSVDLETELNIRYPIYNIERSKDIEIRKSMNSRKKNSKKMMELSSKLNKPELLYQIAEVCRGSELLQEAVKLFNQLQKNYPDWNPDLVKKTREVLADEGSIPKLYTKKNDKFHLMNVS